MKNYILVFLSTFAAVIFILIYMWQQMLFKDAELVQPPVATSAPNREIPSSNPSHSQVILDYPKENGSVSSPLVVEGEARGSWFFEATFPVVLTNWDGLIIAEGFATAQEDWMTEDFVPFTAELTFSVDTAVSTRGSLILQKANASGLPENDDAYEITVYFE